MTLERALLLAFSAAGAVVSVQQFWDRAEMNRASEGSRERGEVLAQIAALQKVMLEASAAQRENRELTNASMAENRKLTNASMAENRATLAADRRAFEASQLKMWGRGRRRPGKRG
jgi:hypothetical protein